MIIADAKTDVQTTNIGQTAQATIKASARLFNFFSDMIYSDKYVAIWRELVANGMDAHVAAGRAHRQMIVTLPTDYTPYAKVRDFGTGMSEVFLVGDPDKGIPSKFMAYTDASTKENSNDFIGGFGIGSKAPLSYTEQFAIHSYQNGICKIYSVYKDEEGCPRITKLAENITDQDDGIEISFPVEGKDVQAFRDAVPDTLRYFNPQPALVNSATPLTPLEYTVRTATWGFLKGAATSRIVQGGIAYPIDKGSVKEIDSFLDFGIDFFVPIGSCSIALSRERLSYDDRTIRVLKSLVDAIRPDIEKHVAEMFTNCKTRWEAEELYAVESAVPNPMRQQLIRQYASWRGHKLIGAFRFRDIPRKLTEKLQLGLITTNRYAKSNYGIWTAGTASPTLRAWYHADIHPKDIQCILIDDGANKPIMRMRRFFDENDIGAKGVMILRPQNKVEVSKTEWLRLIAFLGRPNVKLLSEFEPMEAAKYQGVKRAEKVRAYKSSTYNPPSRKSTFVDTVPATGGYYMTMNTFHVDAGQASMDELRASGLKVDEIFWFNQSDFKVIKDNPLWKPAKVAYEAAVIKYKADHPNMCLAQAMYRFKNGANGYTEDYGWRFVELMGMLGDAAPKRGAMYQLYKLYDTVSGEFNYNDVAMRNLLKLDSTKEGNQIRELFAKAKADYPELWVLIGRRQGSPDVDLLSVYRKLI